ncbi:MAG: hypothetical protein LBJ02_08410 [Bifidobacteriaceae bacterium]|jgi:hypothetical protein|nr:hypothetical protein [Bifidobacteriaceae bacterium]
MRALSVFAGESGDGSHQSKYCPLTLVFHDQADTLAGNIARYESAVRAAGLPNIPFHMGQLQNWHDDYEPLTLDGRRRLMVRFFAFVKVAPIRHKTFTYRSNTSWPRPLTCCSVSSWPRQEFEAREPTVTDSIFFRDSRNLKQNYRTKLRRELLA